MVVIVSHKSASPANPIAVLIFSRDEKVRSVLIPILAEEDWTIHLADNAIEALAILKRRDVSVIIADGLWRDLLDLARPLPKPPNVIVTVPLADEALWAEVLNLGGYDVLAQPFDAYEVKRIVQAASRRSNASAQHWLQVAS